MVFSLLIANEDLLESNVGSARGQRQITRFPFRDDANRMKCSICESERSAKATLSSQESRTDAFK